MRHSKISFNMLGLVQLLVCTIILSSSFGDITTGLVAHLPLNEGSGEIVSDITGNNHNGDMLPSGAGPQWVTGQMDNALSFDEVNDRVVVSDFSYTSSNNFTLSFWFNVSDNSGSYYQYIFSHGRVSVAHSLNVYIYEDGNSSAPGRLRTNLNDASSNPGRGPLDISEDFTDGEWHLYTLSVAQGNITVYIDGVERASSSSGAGSYNPGTNIYFGGRQDLNSSRFYGGNLDDIRFYNRALSASDVSELFSGSGDPPEITTQPSDQTVLEGEAATFSVSATGTEPLSYLWYKNGSPISGAINATYVTPPTTMSDNGAQFMCEVSNAAGSINSSSAILTVNPAPPVITVQPQDQTVDDGQSATFSLTATGTAPLSYQWRKNLGDISGANSAVYITPPVTISDNGAQFDCVVSNVAGSVTSNQAVLTVTPILPQIIQQPVDHTVYISETATFFITATGTVPLSYQWRKDGSDISGATSSTYTTPPVVIGDDGSEFTCVVSNVAGNVTSNAAVLNVSTVPVPPTITTHPQSQTVTEGNDVTFTVVATGTEPFSYQWQKNGVDIGGDNPSLTLSTVALEDAGVYTVTVTNNQGSVTSEDAILTVLPEGGQTNNKKLSMSGMLYDESGEPVGYPEPETIEAIVRLLNHPTAGAVMYTETFLIENNQGVVVDNAFFVIRLGEGTSSDDLQQIISTNPNLWVEITIEGDPSDVLLPRTPLTAVPYSMTGPSGGE